MSSPFESGGRQRPVDVSLNDTDEVVIDGTRLKQERIERGLAVSDAARMATLSREQIEQIENGGLRAFYGARHKLLATRKYADVFGIDLSELVPQAPRPSTASNTLTDTVASPIMATATAPATLPVETGKGMMAQPANRSNFESRRLPLLAVIVVALVLSFSILRGLTPTPKPVAEPVVEPTVEPVATETASPTAESAAPASTTAAAAPPSTSTSAPSSAAEDAPSATATAAAASTNPDEGPDPCAVSAGGDVARWAPTQVRATYTRLYLGSYTESTLCVVDATGAAKPLKLKAGATTSLSGKPPYTIHSAQLPKLQIYLQGLKVKVPTGAVSIQLFTTQSIIPPDSEKPQETSTQ
ncbi:MAG: helix-turn-helix domain-containing protein [Burkholderiaceae bacterium]